MELTSAEFEGQTRQNAPCGSRWHFVGQSKFGFIWLDKLRMADELNHISNAERGIDEAFI